MLNCEVNVPIMMRKCASIIALWLLAAHSMGHQVKQCKFLEREYYDGNGTRQFSDTLSNCILEGVALFVDPPAAGRAYLNKGIEILKIRDLGNDSSPQPPSGCEWSSDNENMLHSPTPADHKRPNGHPSMCQPANTTRIINVTFKTTSLKWLPVTKRLVINNCSLDDDSILSTTDMSKLLVLDLSYNRLRHMPHLPSSCGLLQTLNLSHNMIPDIKLPFPFKCTNLSRIDLSYNKIAGLPDSQLFQENTLSRASRSFSAIDLQGNPINCEDRYRNWFTTPPLISYHKNPVTCAHPAGREVFSVPYPVCNICECNLRDSFVSVNCTSRSLRELPPQLPNNTRTFRLIGGELHDLRLDGIKTSGWDQVREIFVSHNHISDIGNVLDHLTNKLLIFDVSNNNLQRIDQDTAVMMKKRVSAGQTHLSFGHNPWKCDCDLRPFRDFIERVRIRDAYDMKCDGNGAYLYNTLQSELCPPPYYVFHWLDLCIVIMIILIFTIISKVMIDHLRQKRTGKLPRFFSF